MGGGGLILREDDHPFIVLTETKFHVCAACSDCVVVLVWGTSLMIQPQVPEYSRPFQLSLFRTVGGKPMCDVIMY
jgi:hypothetical protein